MANPDHAAAFRAAVEPTPRAAVTHWPLRGPGVRLSGGLLAQWQVRNRDASLPLALRQLKAMGNVDNLRLAIAGAGGTYRGPEFMDSDLYKTLEAIGWKETIADDGAVNDGAA